MKKSNILKQDPEQTAEMLKALAHPSRLGIFALLALGGKDITVKRIYQKMEMLQPVASRHLGILRNAGWVRRIVIGNKTYYRVADGALAQSLANCLRGS